MSAVRRTSGAKSQITNYLARRSTHGRAAPDDFSDWLSSYEDSGLAPPHLAEEITSGDDGKLWTHVWGALLYRHLSACGHEFLRDRVRKSGQLRPDFGISRDGQTIWIEAITPSPEGIPQDWLDPPKRGECMSPRCDIVFAVIDTASKTGTEALHVVEHKAQ